MSMLVFVCACTYENLCACVIYLSLYFHVYENYNQGLFDIVRGLGLAQMMRNQRSPHLKNNITSQHYSFIVGKKTNVQWLINHFLAKESSNPMQAPTAKNQHRKIITVLEGRNGKFERPGFFLPHSFQETKGL